MPCDCSGYPTYEEEELKRMRMEVAMVTRLLCYVCQQMEAGNDYSIIDGNDGLYCWWAAHKEEDRRRERLEKK